ncbi:MAG TPA: MmgE/PrpD family protein [Bradyrhizobium sp.]|uniref:MmgE/PrpD family protein n=1 Tax=Bradyrhizobium sp. TaxID=376 RepID=UPI002B45E424|nr:MmgE/PrpD family protein [Bradyrhizobium sp.]HKO73295.1 MmgE/PrpD family protein [Bradyrhizobium sp.]
MMQAAATSVTRALGRWTAELSLSQVPTEVIAQIKRCLLDSIGCGIYGALQPWGRIAADVAIDFSKGGRCLLFTRGESVSPPDAALANGTAIHGFEIDDAHVSSSLHPGAVTLPAALAAAQVQNASGAELLVALIAGYEVGLRVGICAGVSHSTSGYHVTGTAGTLSAAAAAAKLLRLDGEAASHALAIGATQAAGLYAARLGAMTKRFHAGRAAQSGVIAAYLAAKGFTGSLEAIEAPFGGFLSTLRGQHDAGSILDGLGSTWETARVGLKAYAACASAHTTIDGVRALRANGLTPENLVRMTIRVSKKSAINIGWPYAPAEVITAQMNGQYAAAVTLLDGDAFIDQYAPERLADAKILHLVPRISFVHDPDIDLGGAGKRHTVKIEAVLSDGRRRSTMIEQRRGSSHHPLSDEEILQKFRRLARLALSDEQVEETIARVASFEREPNLKALSELLTKTPTGVTAA